MSSLEDKLDSITQRTRSLVPADRLAFSEQATADLFGTGIEGRLLPVGAVAPEFTLPDARTGSPVHSADLLALGPLVVSFFRGRWCPYCITELEAWRDLFPSSVAGTPSSSPSRPRPRARTASPPTSWQNRSHRPLRFPSRSSPTAIVPSPGSLASPIPSLSAHAATTAPSSSTFPTPTPPSATTPRRPRAGGFRFQQPSYSAGTASSSTPRRTPISASAPNLPLCWPLSPDAEGRDLTYLFSRYHSIR